VAGSPAPGKDVSGAGGRNGSQRRRSMRNPRFAFDIEVGGGGAVAGADEAGRGSLAGPLVTAAVCLDYRSMGRAALRDLQGLDDSKRLSRPQRQALYPVILRHARQVSVVSYSQHTVDREGLHRCNLAGLASALEALEPHPGVRLVDGFALPGSALAHRAVVGGDARSAAIAAASIIAKVTRDQIMIALHARYPVYGFDCHVGYATRAHQQAILTHGVCELHRLSFASVAYSQLELILDVEPSSG
jgi:ribonuclease HII